MTATLEHVHTPTPQIRLARANQISAGDVVAIKHAWIAVTNTTTNRSGQTRIIGYPTAQTVAWQMRIRIPTSTVLQVRATD